MPIPCRDPARPNHLRRSNRHGTVPKTRSMNTRTRSTRLSQLGRPNRVQRPFKITRDMPPTPLRSSGADQNLTAPDRHDNITALTGLPSSCHQACLLFTITSEQDNGGPKARTIAISVSHLRMFRSTPTRIGGARRDRTVDLLHAMQALSHLSYGPTCC